MMASLVARWFAVPEIRVQTLLGRDSGNDFDRFLFRFLSLESQHRYHPPRSNAPYIVFYDILCTNWDEFESNVIKTVDKIVPVTHALPCP